MKFKKERTKNTCTISALYLNHVMFCLIDNTNCACSDQPAQNHALAVALVQVVMALLRTNPSDLGLGKNFVFFPHSAFQSFLSSSRRTTLFTASKFEKIVLALKWPS